MDISSAHTIHSTRMTFSYFHLCPIFHLIKPVYKRILPHIWCPIDKIINRSQNGSYAYVNIYSFLLCIHIPSCVNYGEYNADQPGHNNIENIFALFGIRVNVKLTVTVIYFTHGDVKVYGGVHYMNTSSCVFFLSCLSKPQLTSCHCSNENKIYKNRQQFHLPRTIQITMQLPMIAMSSILPNKNAQPAFCSHGISYGRRGECLKQSVMKSLLKLK